MLVYQLLFTTFCWLLFISKNNGESGCDEVDILFVVEDTSIIANGDNIIEFITYIAEHECSEYAGFSVSLYGDKIPNSSPDILLPLVETEIIHQRAPLIELINERLTEHFNLVRFVTDEYKSTSLLSAFAAIKTQPQPKRKHYKDQCKRVNDDNCRIGLHDDTQRIFVFDHNNLLSIDQNTILYETWKTEYELDQTIPSYVAQDSNADICALIEYIEDNESIGEGLMIMQGQPLNDENIVIICDNEIPHLIQDQQYTFIEFTDNLIDDFQLMETIGNTMTCPANLEINDGDLNLGNHVQWIPTSVLITCSLGYLDNSDDINTSPQLTSESYIIVKDYPDDDMTYQQYDYIIFDPDTLSNTPEECSIPVLKLIQIEEYEEDDREEEDNSESSYRLLKIAVQIPLSPMEYISDINANGENVRVETEAETETETEIFENNDDNDDNEEQRRLIYLNIDASKQLLNLNIEADYELTRGPDYSGSNTVIKSSAYSKPSVEWALSGTLALKYGAGFEVDLSVQYKLNWFMFSADVEIQIKLVAFYRLYAYFTATMYANAEVTIKDLIRLQKWTVFWLGPVPVLMRPFITLDASFKAIPIEVTAGFNCEYSEQYEIGYYYKSVSSCGSYNYYWGCGWDCTFACGVDYCEYYTSLCDCCTMYSHRCRVCVLTTTVTEYPINTRTLLSDTCGPVFESSNVNSDDDCPVAEFGFDITLDLNIGASFYEAFVVYFKASLGIPFRFIVPATTPELCGYSSTTDMCASTSLKAAFTVEIDLDFYFGYEFIIGRLLDMIAEQIASQIVGIGLADDVQVDIFESFSANEYLIGHYDILPQTSLGCLELPTILGNIYRPLCCGWDTGGWLEICATGDSWSGTAQPIAARLWIETTSWGGGNWRTTPVYELHDNGAFDRAECAQFSYFIKEKDVYQAWRYLDLMLCGTDGIEIGSIRWWDSYMQSYRTLEYFSVSNYADRPSGYASCSDILYNNAYGNQQFWLDDSNRCQSISISFPSLGSSYTGAWIWESPSWIESNFCDMRSDTLPYLDRTPRQTPPKSIGDYKDYKPFNNNNKLINIFSKRSTEIIVGLLSILILVNILYFTYYFCIKSNSQYKSYKIVKVFSDTDVENLQNE